MLEHGADADAACGDKAAPAIEDAALEHKLLKHRRRRIQHDVEDGSAAVFLLGAYARVLEVSLHHVGKVSPGIVTQVARQAADPARHFNAIMRILPFWKDLRRVAHTLPYDAAVMRRFELPAVRLSGIRVPTLVVGGGKSPTSLKAAVRAVAQAVPGAQFSEIPGQSHAIKASALAPVVRRFVEA